MEQSDFDAIQKAAMSEVEPYVPVLQRTKGQPPPNAANGGLSYMSFDRNGDAGTAAAIEAALKQIAGGEGQAVIDMIESTPPGPSKPNGVSAFADMQNALSTFKTTTLRHRKVVLRFRCVTPSTSNLHTRSCRAMDYGRILLGKRRQRRCVKMRKTVLDALCIFLRRYAMRDVSRSTTLNYLHPARNVWTH